MAVEQNERYSMNHWSRGPAYIINNATFDRQQSRNSSSEDVRKLTESLGKHSFQTIVYNNITAQQMDQTFKTAAEADYQECDCFLAVILSRGSMDFVSGIDGQISIEQLTSHLKDCPSLAGKPKIIVIQGSRGEKFDSGTLVADATGEPDLEPVRIPKEADFLYYFSTPPYYRAFRNTEQGSFFITSLCNELNSLDAASTELMNLLTRVNYRVATEFVSRTSNPESNNMLQMPAINSMLTKQLFLTSKS